MQATLCCSCGLSARQQRALGSAPTLSARPIRTPHPLGSKAASAQRACSPDTGCFPTRRFRAIQAQAVQTAEPPANPAKHRPLDDVVIVAAVRTPMCKALVGKLKDAPMDDLVIAVMKELLNRTGVKAEEVGDVCMGSGLGPSSKRANEVRTALILSGFPVNVPAYTVNRQCAAGLQSIADMTAQIAAGFIDIGIAGGVESMSKSPMKWEGSENPKLEDNADAKDTLTPMGITSDNVASRFNVPREMQDRLAVASHAKAAAAQDAGVFKDEIVPVESISISESGEVTPVVATEDEGIRRDFTMQKLSKMRGCFQRGGTTTVGNACQTTDGAAAVMLMRKEEAERRGLPVLATMKSFSAVGVPPAVMGIGPAVAIPKALEKAGLSKEDIEVFEINEAFASQFGYCLRELGLDEEKVNPNGGALALGHPIGCSGARLTVSLLHELGRRSKNNGQKPHYGVVSMCVGSGMGAAAVFECGKSAGNGAAKPAEVAA